MKLKKDLIHTDYWSKIGFWNFLKVALQMLAILLITEFSEIYQIFFGKFEVLQFRFSQKRTKTRA